MALVKPRELVAGGGRGLTVRGRVLSKRHVKVIDQFFTEIHVVSEAGNSGVFYVESWRDEALRLNREAASDATIDLENLKVLPLGAKAAYQCSTLDVFGQITQNVIITPVAQDNVPATLPASLPHVDLAHVRGYLGRNHQVNVIAHFLDLEPARTIPNGNKVARAWLVKGNTRISLSIWQECIPAAENVTPGEVVFSTRLSLKSDPEDARIQYKQINGILARPTAARQRSHGCNTVPSKR